MEQRNVPVGTAPSSKEEAAVGVVSSVASSVACIVLDHDPGLRLLLAVEQQQAYSISLLPPVLGAADSTHML